MTKNTLLNIAISVSRLLKIILIIAAIVLTGLFVYAQIDKETFADKEIVLSANPSLTGVSYIVSNVWKENTKDATYDLKPYTFGKLKTVSLYINYFKGLIVAVLMFLIIRAFETIMLSVKTLKTFSRSNVKLFRQIGLYVVFVTILTSYTVLRFESGEQTVSHVSLTPVIYTLLAFIMAEIFKEGENLREENDLTI
jgi:small-conductance mechanosensitive channel